MVYTSTNPIEYYSKGDDLLHPHKQNRIPGYVGYTPQYKFHCGHTYGYQTDKLKKQQQKEYLYRGEIPLGDYSQVNLVPDGDGNKKYFRKMVPGYSGFVPRLQTKFGSRYQQSTESAIQDFNSNLLRRSADGDQLSRSLSLSKPLQAIEGYQRPTTSHPGLDLRYATAERSRHFSDKRPSSEAPTIGYQGHIPRKIEHDVGKRYTVWTENALNHATGDRMRREMSSTKPIQFENASSNYQLADNGRARPNSSGVAPSRFSRYGSIYEKQGMIPKYTGHVPQHNYSLGRTFGDGTRSVPVCYDTPGYANGKYVDPGTVHDRLTIKA